MRKALSHIAAIGASAVIAAVLLPAGTASAATSNDCDPVRSTKIVTGGLFGNTTDHLWVDHPTATRTVVCFQFTSLSLGGLTIVADTATGLTPPYLAVGSDPNLCPSPVLTLADPVPVRLAVSVPTNSVCLTVGTRTLTVQFTAGGIAPSPVPVFELWRDGGPDWGWIDVAACPVEYIVAVTTGGPTTCMETNDRILP
jgi:hypothetical protein